MGRAARRWLLGPFCGLLMPTLVLGQTLPDQGSSPDWQDTTTSRSAVEQEIDWLEPEAKPGAPLRVIDRSGKSTTGRLVHVLPTSIRLASGGVTHEVPLAEVATVQRNGDALWNGVAWGGGFAGFMFLGYNGDCDTCYSGAELASFRLALAGIGAGIGALLDLMVRDRRVLYQAPSPVTTARRVSVRPIVAPHARGLVVSVRLPSQ